MNRRELIKALPAAIGLPGGADARPLETPADLAPNQVWYWPYERPCLVAEGTVELVLRMAPSGEISPDSGLNIFCWHVLQYDVSVDRGLEVRWLEHPIRLYDFHEVKDWISKGLWQYLGMANFENLLRKSYIFP